MFGWGVNSHGQLGLGPSSITSFISKPTSIDCFTDRTCIQIACSLTHSLFLINDGSIYSAGNNDYSQLGRQGRTTIPGKFASVRILSDFELYLFVFADKVNLPENTDGVQVACGQHFSACLTTTGKIIIWGSVSGKITNDDGLFFEKPEYVFYLFMHSKYEEFIFNNRYLEGFDDRRMIQIAAGYNHCLGLTDVNQLILL